MNIPSRIRKPPKPERRDQSTQRRSILAAWRGVDLAPWERSTANGTRPAAGVVAGVLHTLNLDRRRNETEIVKVWNRLLDPNIAAHAQPVGLNRGTLFVQVDSSAWLSELVRYRQREILNRLQASFGSQVIRRISFRAG